MTKKAEIKLIFTEIVGKHVLIGYTYNRTDGKFDHQEQKHGTVVKANETEDIGVRLHNSDEVVWLPPDLSSWKPAPEGT